MLNERSIVGIAQSILYAPVVSAAAILLFYRHGRPRLGWYFLFIFSLFRLAGGIAVIQLEKNPGSVGLLIASIILLGVGVIPLLSATIGLLRIILVSDFADNNFLHRLVALSRILVLIGVVLLSAGGSLEGHYNSPTSVATGDKLVKAGYSVLAIILALLIVFQAYLWTKRIKLTTPSATILKGTTSAIPFLVVRITYAFLGVFDSQSSDSKWNNLHGSIAAFVIMALIMEYVAVVLYISVGLINPPTRRSAPEQKGVDISSLGQAGTV